MIRFSHEANSWQFKAPTCGEWINISVESARRWASLDKIQIVID